MFYSDRAIGSQSEDKLNRSGFARLLAKTLVNLNSEDTFTVGLFGKWGSGKTSIVNMTLSEIDSMQSQNPEGQQIIVVHFEPWNFTDTNQLLTQFFVRLANEFQKKSDENLTKIGQALERYSDAFSLLELIPTVGAPIATASKWGVNLLGKKMQRGLDERDVLKQKDQVIKLLSEQSNRILVVLDDIDRLSNEQIRYVFQLITSVARFPKTTYLLVFDKEIVVEALKDVQSGNGQDYLEKVIQMPIQIPDIRRTDLRNVLFDQLDQIKADFPDVGFSPDHWRYLFEVCVDPFIKHLRDVNRLSNTLRFKLAGVPAEIDYADMIALSILEIHHPLVYEWIKVNKSTLTGEFDFSLMGNSWKEIDWKKYYAEMLQELVLREYGNAEITSHTELVMKALTRIFPYFARRVGMLHEAYEPLKYRKNNQVAHADKFDRYFSLTLDDLPYTSSDVHNLLFRNDAVVITAFIRIQDHKGSSYELLEDIKARIPEISGERAIALSSGLFEAMKYLDQRKATSWLSNSSRSYAEHMMLDVIERIPSADRLAFFTDLISDASLDALPSIAVVINLLELAYGRLAANGQIRDYKRVISLDELLSVEKVFTNRIKKLLATNSLFDFYDWRMVYHLLDSFDHEYVSDYLKDAFIQDVNVLHFLGNYVTIWVGSGREYEIKKGYLEFFSTERVQTAIEACRQSGVFFNLAEDLQFKCAAFCIAHSEDQEKRLGIYQDDVEALIRSWKQ